MVSGKVQINSAPVYQTTYNDSTGIHGVVYNYYIESLNGESIVGKYQSEQDEFQIIAVIQGLIGFLEVEVLQSQEEYPN